MTLFKKHALAGMCLSMVVIASCGTPKRSIYFRTNEPMDATTSKIALSPAPQVTVKTDDILAINVTSSSSVREDLDPVLIYNDGGIAMPAAALGGGQATRTTGTGKGYLVDSEGFIDFPVIGKLAVGGMTIRQVKEILQQKLATSIKDPVVEVRIMNYKVILLGEVGAPGVVLSPGHGMNILEAIAAAGDIKLTGSKDNVLLIRQEDDGTKKMIRLNLNSAEIFNSPYFELKQNDIVYVEPNRLQRSQNSEFLRLYLPAITSVISTALAVYGIVQIADIKK